jgi:hypothetical protein
MSNQKAVCPTDSGHKQFKAIAVVQRLWTVDEYGQPVVTDRAVTLDVLSRPDMGHDWLCAACGAVAEIVETGGAA